MTGSLPTEVSYGAGYRQPNSSNNYIVTETVYDPTISSRGAHRRYDQQPRRKERDPVGLDGPHHRTIQNFDGLAYGTQQAADSQLPAAQFWKPIRTNDVTTDFQYDYGGRLVTQTAHDAKGSGKGVANEATKTSTIPRSMPRSRRRWSLPTRPTRFPRTPRSIGQSPAARTTRRRLTTCGAAPLHDDRPAGGGAHLPLRFGGAAICRYGDLAGRHGEHQRRGSRHRHGFRRRGPCVNGNQLQQRRLPPGKYRQPDRRCLRRLGKSNPGVAVAPFRPAGQHEHHAQCPLYVCQQSSGAAKYMRLGGLTYPDGTWWVIIILRQWTTSCRGSRALARTAPPRPTPISGRGHDRQREAQSTQVKLDYSAGNFAAWDRFGRVLNQVWASYAASGSTLDAYQYGYDRDSNRTSQAETYTNSGTLANGPSQTFQYDLLDRLKYWSQTGIQPASETWTPDSLGNDTSGTTFPATRRRPGVRFMTWRAT